MNRLASFRVASIVLVSSASAAFAGCGSDVVTQASSTSGATTTATHSGAGGAGGAGVGGAAAGGAGGESTTSSSSSSTTSAGGAGGAAPSGVGDACTKSGDCAKGDVCLPENYGLPGGYCSKQCAKAADCPADAHCAKQFGYCLKSCTQQGDCRDGYECSPMGHVCVPPMGGEPTLPPGTNNGQACVQPIVQPPGQGALFEADMLLSSGPMNAEVELAADPAHHRVVVAWIAVGMSGDSIIGTAISDDDGATFKEQPPLPANGAVDTNNNQSDPVVAFDPAGNAYVAWVGFDRGNQDPNPTNMNMYVATAKQGAGFDSIAKATPPGEWQAGGFLDKPWIAASPTDGALYVTWSRQASQQSPVDLRVARSSDGGVTWAPPLTFSDGFQRPNFARNLAQITVGADGTPYATWVEVQNEQFGSPTNAVYFQRFKADGSLDGDNVLVTGGSDSPSFDDPSIAVSGQNVYIGFASGDKSGAWDLRVAASLDNGTTWRPSVKANDDATCATHFHHQIATAPNGDVHIVYYDNRYLFGSVMHQQSAGAAVNGDLSFGKATFVNSKTFDFSADRSSQGWLGDYLGFWIAGGKMFAAWSDPRNQGSSQIYFARGDVK